MPEKFNNKTNGVTHRRWLVNANPKLTELSLGLNFGDALLMAFGQKYSSFDLSATLNMWNRFQPVLIVGL